MGGFKTPKSASRSCREHESSTRAFLPEYIQKYATEEALKEQEEGGGDSSSESSMSDFSEDEAQDMEL